MRPLVAETIVPNDTILIAWHGPEPRLRTADEFTSYLETFTVTVGFGFPSVKAAPTVVAASRIVVTVQVQVTDSFDYHAVYLQDLDGSFGGTGTSLLIRDEGAQSLGSFAGNVWHSFTYTLMPGLDYVAADVEAALAAGRFAVLSDVFGSDLDGETRMFTSQLDLEIGGEKWLRGVQRNDGLSHSVPRGVQISSRQRSLRGVGYQ